MFGVSALLDRLNREKTKKIAEKYGGQVIFTSGGSAMILFTDSKISQGCCDEIQTEYLEQTGLATITGVIVEIKEGPFKKKPTDTPFKQAILKAGVELQKAKAAGRLPARLISQPHWARCQRCRVYPVVEAVQDTDGTLGICSVCSIKRKAFQSSPLDRLEQIPGNEWIKNVSRPQTLNDLGSNIVLIYADGNGIGNLIDNLINSPEEMTALSQILDGAVMQAISESTRDLVRAINNDRVGD